ncbi:DMT family transporter [Zavarzinia sp. CC-PAN008]|uniref:DMT family transporter n=1 Tax=Zavarzinia sp. CC-PAN008 TaxID=3243332 RepID=UPI003F74AC72
MFANPVTWSWVLLSLAGLLEIAWPIALKYSEGFTRPVPIAISLALGLASFALLGVATKHLPIGTAYVAWMGFGAAGAAILGMVVFGESASPIRLACVGLVILGIVGLNLTGNH